MAAMLAWGVAYVPSAWLVETWPPISAAGARLTLAGVMLLGVLALLGQAGELSVGLWLVLGRRAAPRGRLVDSPTPP